MWITCPNPECNKSEFEVKFLSDSDASGPLIDFKIVNDCGCREEGIPPELIEEILSGYGDYKNREPDIF